MSTPTQRLGSEAMNDRGEILFFEALKQPAEAREAFLEQQCREDRKLRAEIEELLRDHEKAGGFLKVDAPVSDELAEEFARLKPEETGDRIGPYKLLEQIGEGGFGRVWVAEQERPIRRRVALKIIKLGMDTKDVVARFEQERQALALMDHPNIAKVLDAGGTPTGRPFFVMELVRGVKITDYCDQVQLSTADRLKLFIAVCHAVQHAHQKGIIHRDLKPSNVLVALHDGVPVPKVIDFGVAKATQQQRLTELTVYTHFEQMIGTPLYMSPEQAEFSGLDVDTRSDIYSLGVLLYELLTGRTPFDAKRLMNAGLDEMRRVIREEEPQKPSTLLSTMAVDVRTDVAKHRHSEAAKLITTIKGDLDWIVMKALEKDRTRRYETANGLAKDIERHLANEPVQARPPSTGYRFRRWLRRNKGVFAAGTGVAAALIIGSAVSIWQALRAGHEADRAVSALNDLRASAPAFAAMAGGLVAKEQFDEAIEKLDAAIKLQPDAAQYVVAKANVLQSQFHFAEASALYREALRLNPAEKHAEWNSGVCERLAKEMAEQANLSQKSLQELLSSMKDQQRSAAEMMRAGKLLGEEQKLLLDYWLERLKDLPIAPDKPLEKRLVASQNGSLVLDLSKTLIEDLSPLRGMPLDSLFLSGCPRVKDLEPLRGMALRALTLGHGRDEKVARWEKREPTRVKDLSPLAGMPLTILDLSGTPVEDLMPLVGMPLNELDLGWSEVTDLTPLKGMPLTWLSLAETGVKDLTPLAGMPLKFLLCAKTNVRDFSPLQGAPLEYIGLDLTPVTDLSFLRGMPLTQVSLDLCHDARGYRVLSDIPTLRYLQVPAHFMGLPVEEVNAIAALRNHPNLELISADNFGKAERESNTSLRLSADFWRTFDQEIQARRTLQEMAGGKAEFRQRSGGTWSVYLTRLPVSDLSPLRGMSISELYASDTKIVDLTPLEGMPLERLWISRTLVSDLSPLKGLPLGELRMADCLPGIDVSPLASVSTLKRLHLPPSARNVEALRKLPNLIALSFEYDNDGGRYAQTAREFWSGKPPVTVESLAREGKFAEAEMLMRNAPTTGIEFSEIVTNRLALGTVVFAQRDLPHYHELCKQMMESLNMMTALSADTTARVCLLGADSGISISELENLVDAASRVAKPDINHTFQHMLSRGLLEYRAGRPEKAAEVLNQVLSDSPAINATATAILSMAYFGQGDHRAARLHLAVGRKIIGQHWPAKDPKELSRWVTWLTAHLLLQEAEQLIEKPALPSRKRK